MFDGHEMTDFLNAKAIVLWANNVAETSLPDWRIIADAQKQGVPGRVRSIRASPPPRPRLTSGSRSVRALTPR